MELCRYDFPSSSLLRSRSSSLVLPQGDGNALRGELYAADAQMVEFSPWEAR
jgi:hypothetical protein